MTASLFPTLSDDTAQWRLAGLQVCNWGGYHGHHHIPFSPGTTLLTGASGCGKSTLLDAYIALMMPSSVPFNGASNAGGGRARGGEQRNLLTYIRGKQDTAADGTDTLLRGHGTATWGAVAATFKSTAGATFTALKIIQVAADARANADLRTTHATFAGALDLQLLDSCREQGFRAHSLTGVFPGIRTYGQIGDFRAAVYMKLGIGDPGAGDPAMQLLARIQAGQSVRSVNELYRSLVLEKPETYSAADQALSEFAANRDAHQALLEAESQEACLEPLPALYTRYEEAQSNEAQLSRLRIKDSTGPLTYWLKTRELDLCKAALAEVAGRLSAAEDDHQRAKQHADGLWRVLQEKAAACATHGDQQLPLLQSRKATADGNLRRIQGRRARLQRKLNFLGELPRTQAEFQRLCEQATAFHAQKPTIDSAHAQKADDLSEARRPLLLAKTTLQAELRSLENRRDSVPSQFAEARDLIAQATNLTREDLPFAAELIDVKDETWRVAAEATLRGVGLTMLMDTRHQQLVRDRIDGMDLGVRLRFEGVDTDNPPTVPNRHADPRMLSAILEYKQSSPFCPWVQHVTQRADNDHLRVDGPSELGGDDPRVTQAGQTSRGRRGAHGRLPGDRAILGFTNEGRKAAIRAELKDVESELHATQVEKDRLSAARTKHTALAAEHSAILDELWEELDVASAEADATEADTALLQYQAQDTTSATLRQEEETARARYENGLTEVTRLEVRLKSLREKRGELDGQAERCAHALRRISATTIATAEDVDTYLAEAFHESAGDVTPDQFPRAEVQFAKELATKADSAATSVKSARDSLERLFEDFQRQWPDPTRGTSIHSYDDYRTIHHTLKTDRLGEQRAAYESQLVRATTDALTALSQGLKYARADIDKRLSPINSVLAGLPFGADGNRLRIQVADHYTAEFERFRRELGRLGSSFEDTHPDAVSHRFHEINGFLDQISPEAGSSRDRLLDIRKQIVITACEENEAGETVAVFDSLGGKSGGETQELVAFIIGAALRYRLGDSSLSHPRFAPVILDEGFIKSDARFAGRAIHAWQNLGFQLILGTPIDKTGGLESHCDELLLVHKSPDGYSRVSALKSEDAERC